MFQCSKLSIKSDIFNLNTPYTLLQREGKSSGIPLFPRGGRGCCLIYILVKAKLLFMEDIDVF